MAANGITSKGAIVAIGYQDTGSPGQLYLAFSTSGGKDYRRSNGNLRRYPIVGTPQLGMSVAICSGRVWAATAYHSASDKAGDSDVFLTSRSIGGGAAQALMTDTAGDRRVRDVSVACVGNNLIAIAWLQKTGSKDTAQLMLRSMEPLGATPSFKQVYSLGDADFRSGLDVAATPALVAVSFARGGDLKLKRFGVAGTTVAGQPIQTLGKGGIKFPLLAARGKRLVLAYSDAGKVRVRTSRDLGQTISKQTMLASTGGIKNPSVAWSLDVAGDRIVGTAGVYSAATKKITPTRYTTSTFGDKWSKRSFGNVGARVAALMKTKKLPPLLREAWHNNAPKGSTDTLRARYELP
jgi:hypothetical protein